MAVKPLRRWVVGWLTLVASGLYIVSDRIIAVYVIATP
ncbi:hypothetical protein XM38_016730 [Halomicronema hongdechloris C2206]|uniref:Uncharacterized protein n=1 Tax=Halomicronema hongdechloris C2206 TaxID=1641165 RepID=A0A1Z3HKA3_9CYAN|nr:hypothetical protein XM38_016730 [Halomicronema hongdechloris C2206]